MKVIKDTDFDNRYYAEELLSEKYSLVAALSRYLQQSTNRSGSGGKYQTEGKLCKVQING